jgi:protease-4
MSESRISFGRIFWPTLVALGVALFLGMVVFFLVLGGVIGSFSNFGPEPYAVEKGSILHMKLKGEIQEKSNEEFNPSTFRLNKSLGLPDVLLAINKAKSDSHIKGIYIDIDEVSCGISTARSIRNALQDFQKNSGKFVISYYQGEAISQREFYIGSVAKESYAFPTSNFMLTGLGAEVVFFKKLLDKLDVEVQVIRGENNDFKSAVEPFFLTSLSDSARLQNQVMLSGIWKELSNDIAASRKVKTADLNNWIDNMEILNCESALKHRLIDGLLYQDEMMDKLAEKVGEKSPSDIRFADFNSYANTGFYEDQILVNSQDPSVAVIIAEGEVAKGGDGVNSDRICKYFQKVRKNDEIKAVVFRINSPGGSALASEEIWREVMLTQKKKKVIVSMGDVAASGGYYIASPADYIFAEATTITGSIGVFGMIPYTGKMFENKLGLTFDRVQTNKHSVLSTNKKLSPEEFAGIQSEVNVIYKLFLTRVSEGRKLSVERVNQLARGRVWTGSDAKRIGLVDQLGGMDEAIAYAKKAINDQDSKVIYYPLVKEDKFATILKMIEDETEEEEVKIKQTELPNELLRYYEEIRKIEGKMGIQMRVPYELIVQF